MSPRKGRGTRHPKRFTRGTENALRWPYSESALVYQNDNPIPWGRGWEARPVRRRAGR